jgi:3,4-dihydroxy 2-butanone 4-phosphate synthase/GTP cyclohydrolase II
MCCFEDHVHRTVHLALVRGDVTGAVPPLVRVHLKDTLRDVVGIRDDVLGWPLRSAMQRIAKEGAGVVVILRPEETPRDLMEAVAAISHPDPTGQRPGGAKVLRTYGIGAQILRDLGVHRMRVLSAPKQMHGLSGFDLEVVEYVEG